jgi:hypothetical protein
MTEGHRDAFAALLQRVCSEYLEMPGLRLTPRQAARLWGLDETTCHRILDILVDVKFLCETAPGSYARSTAGRLANPPFPGALIG